MKELNQKFHGLPGAVITGLPGNTGAAANSTYIGFINDFFDGVTIKADTIVKAAHVNNNEIKRYFSELNADRIKFAVKTITGVTPDSSDNLNNYTKAYIDAVNKNLSIMYTGSFIKSTDNITADILNISAVNANAVELDQNYISDMHLLLGDSKDAFTLLNNTQFEYVDILNVSSVDNYQYFDRYDYDLANISPLLASNICMFETKNDQSYNILFSIEIEDKSTNQYAIGPAGYFTILNYSPTGSTEYGEFTINPGYDSAKLLDIDRIKNDEYLYNKSSIISDEVVFDEADSPLTDYNENNFIWIDPYKTNTKELKDINAIISSYNILCKDGIIPNKKPVDEFYTALDSKPTYKQDPDHHYVYWSLDENNKNIFIPTTLKPDIKVGDVLYFYTNESDYKEDHNLTYMVVISNEMIGCSLQQLIKSAQIIDPLKVKYMYDVNGRVTSYYNTTSLYTSLDASTNEIKQSLLALTGIPNTDANLLLLNSNNKFINLNAVYKDFNIDSLIGPNTYSFEILSNNQICNIKCDSLAIDNLYIDVNSDTNLELQTALYDDGIIFNNGFIKPVTSISTYDVNNHLYLGTDLHKQDYIDKQYINNDSYVYGYEVYDITNQLLYSEMTSKENLLMFIDIKNINLSDNDVRSILISQYLEIGSVNNMNLDWSNKQYEYVGWFNYKDELYIVYDSKIKAQQVIDVYGHRLPRHTIKILFNLDRSKAYTFATFNTADNAGYYFYNENHQTNGATEVYTNLVYDSNGQLEYKNAKTFELKLNSFTNEDDENIVYPIKLYPLDLVYNQIVDIIYPASMINKNDVYRSSNYIVLFAMNKNNGIKYYSKVVELNSFINQENVLSGYTINLLGDNENLIHNTSDYISFVCDSISCEENIDKHIILDVNNNIDVSSMRYYINGRQIALDGSTYSNEWMNITAISEYEFIIDTSNNLPVNIDGNAYNSIDEYLSVGTDITGLNRESDLFAYITKNGELPKSILRSAKLQIVYNVKNDPYRYIQSYNITQPGFTDNRYIPNIGISMNNDIISVQNNNTLENNVKCNQLVTYLDIDISDIKNLWAGCVSDYSNLGISFDITNTGYDSKWKDTYIVDDRAVFRSTIKFLPYIDDKEIISDDILNNYVSLIAECDSNIIDMSDTSIYYQRNDSNSNRIECQEDTNGKIYLNDNNIPAEDSIKNYGMISNGIYKVFTIKADINDITKLSEDKIRIKFIFEIGNPIVSSLFLSFAITNLNITYKDNNNETHIFTTSLAMRNDDNKQETLLHIFDTDYTLVYKFSSNEFEAIIHPMSYIICPEDQETDIQNISGNIYKVGSEKQIMKQLSFFNPNIYESAKLIGLTPINIRQGHLYDWKALLLNKSYMQDNIKSIVVKSLQKKININEDEIVYSNEKYDYNYLNITYFSTIMLPRIRLNGQYTFYYNMNEYSRDKYNQYFDKPIFANESIEMELRSLKLINAMDKWNDVYMSADKRINDVTFSGNISSYSNGYMFLDSTYDYGQFNSLYSLNDTKQLNSVKFYSDVVTKDIEHVPYIDNSNVVSNEPDAGRYYRTFVYDVKWSYPHLISEDTVELYPIVSAYDYYHNQNIGTTVNYNELFNIYPRVAFNTNEKTLNVFMLRCPVIGHDDDKEVTDITKSRYMLLTKYFDLTDEIMPNAPTVFNV